jgi:hypothetical protein
VLNLCHSTIKFGGGGGGGLSLLVVIVPIFMSTMFEHAFIFVVVYKH